MPGRIVYIAGFGRSGSTLLEKLLGELDGVFAAGEVCFFGERVLREGTVCGCGSGVESCPFWSFVLARLAPDGQESSYQDALQHFQRWGSNRALPRLALAMAMGLGRKELERYLESLRVFYRAVFAESGARVVVDSSKYPPYAWLLTRLDLPELWVIHLIRDSRATAHSWRKRRVYESREGDVTLMRRHSLVGSCLRWWVYNLGAEALRLVVGPRYLRVRYEDLTSNPRGEFGRICSFLGEDPAPSTFRAESEALLGAGHQVAGNPFRFETGLVEISRRDQWKDEMGGLSKALVSVLTSPLLHFYGYTGAKG